LIEPTESFALSPHRAPFVELASFSPRVVWSTDEAHRSVAADSRRNVA
jgi:hypothetical protein